MLTGLPAIAGRLGDIADILPDLELLVLFGSQASGRATRRSDVDVAISCVGPADLDAAYLALAPRIGSDRARPRRPAPRRPTAGLPGGPPRRVALRRRPGTFREFQSLASRRYCDTAKLRRAQQRAIQVFLEREGLA